MSMVLVPHFGWSKKTGGVQPAEGNPLPAGSSPLRTLILDTQKMFQMSSWGPSTRSPSVHRYTRSVGLGTDDEGSDGQHVQH